MSNVAMWSVDVVDIILFSKRAIVYTNFNQVSYSGLSVLGA